VKSSYRKRLALRARKKEMSIVNRGCIPSSPFSRCFVSYVLAEVIPSLLSLFSAVFRHKIPLEKKFDSLARLFATCALSSVLISRDWGPTGAVHKKKICCLFSRLTRGMDTQKQEQTQVESLFFFLLHSSSCLFLIAAFL
jgi:hypothetical protein